LCANHFPLRLEQLVPNDNTRWILLHQFNDVNVGLRRTRVIGVDGTEEDADWDYVVQEQQDTPIVAVTRIPLFFFRVCSPVG
jgi:hypothetical protein